MKVLFIFALVTAVLQASPLHIQKKPFYLDAVKADWEDCCKSSIAYIHIKVIFSKLWWVG